LGRTEKFERELAAFWSSGGNFFRKRCLIMVRYSIDTDSNLWPADTKLPHHRQILILD